MRRIDCVHVEYDKNTRQIRFLSSDDNLVYCPSPTIKKFHDDNEHVRLLIGPFGSGKSSGCCLEIIRRAIEMPLDNRGVRKSRWIAIRNTASDLQTTCVKTWLDWAEFLGETKRNIDPVLTYTHRFNDGKGLIELEIMFLALDIPKDVRKLKSLELTGAWIEEASEIQKLVFDIVQLRVGRFPRNTAESSTPYWSGVICSTNPPDIDHWIYKLFEEQRNDGFKIYHQPPGLLKKEGKWVENSQAENLAHLPAGYYLKAVSGHSEEFIKVFCLGEYGQISKGKVVFPEYNDDLHSSAEIELLPEEPVILGWDFGLTPSCLFLQQIDGQIRAVKEFCLEYGSLKELAETEILPYILTNKLMMEASVGDLAGATPGQVDLISNFDYLTQEANLPTVRAETNVLQPRLDAVKWGLNTLIGGQPAFILSRHGCPTLRKGFNGSYYKKRIQIVGDERYRDIPDKTHPFSDIHDCLQYGIMHYLGAQKNQLSKLDNPQMRMNSAWI